MLSDQFRALLNALPRTSKLKRRIVDLAEEANFRISDAFEGNVPVDRFHSIVAKPEHHVYAILSRGRFNVARQPGGASQNGADFEGCDWKEKKLYL